MLNGACAIEFDETRDIVFHPDKTLPPIPMPCALRR